MENEQPEKSIEKQREENIEKMQALAGNYRGQIIQSAANLEYMLETFIGNYYTNGDLDKANDLYNALIGTQSFSFYHKRTLVWYAIRKFLDEKKDTELNNQFRKLSDSLDLVNSMRNIVAHRKLLINDIAVDNFNGETIFLHGTYEQNLKPFNEAKVLEEVALSIHTGILIGNIMDKMGIGIGMQKENPEM